MAAGREADGAGRLLAQLAEGGQPGVDLVKGRSHGVEQFPSFATARKTAGALRSVRGLRESA